MFSHLFLLSNNKYIVINNNNKHYKLFDAINEYSKHSWIINNQLSFISHITSKLINRENFNNQYKNLYGVSNVYIVNDLNNDKWSYYGINNTERFKNPIVYHSKYHSKVLASQ